MTTPRPFQRLDDRLVGHPIDDTLLEGVPHTGHVAPGLDRHRSPVGTCSGRGGRTPAPIELESRYYRDELVGVESDELLVVMDVILQLQNSHNPFSHVPERGNE